MTDTDTISVEVSQIPIRRKARARIALIGNPNAGKSTLFNRLTGLRQRTGNFPGVTVERHSGVVQSESTAVALDDLPGIYSLSGDSMDERIAVDFVSGNLPGADSPDGFLVVVAATHLYQGLFLIEQLRELQRPMLVALTMVDAALANGVTVDAAELSSRLGGIPVCPVATTLGQGVDELKQQLLALSSAEPASLPRSWPAMSDTASQLAAGPAQKLDRLTVVEGLLDSESPAAASLAGAIPPEDLARINAELFQGDPPRAVEARERYQWAQETISQVLHSAPATRKWGARAARFLNQPWPATVMFFITLILVFQAVFSWATPLMDMIDGASGVLAEQARSIAGTGAFGSFLADGVIAGVGSVVIFLPQILILFLFIILLEDTGYLARAAFLMDKGMRSVGLSGQSVIPMLSSFACAVPSIMATRVIPNRRDRIATILAAPFMTCSARLPIYALLIAAFVPATSLGWFNLQGLVLFGLYLLGIFGGLLTAFIMKRTALKGPKPLFALALPEFRRPNMPTVLMKLWDRVRIFLKRAGTVIFLVAVLVWALAYFPRMDPAEFTVNAQSSLTMENQLAAAQLEQSYLGRMGKQLEPVFRPLGWDWKVSSAVIAGFPAREVVVAVMGTLYAVGSDADENSLAERLKAATWPDGRLIFTLPMVLGLMVFYAWCLQCAATVAVIRRETNSWRWPLFAWGYMTSVAYLGALLVYQVGSRI